ncbi:MAG: 2'-5' RNA ligase family protein [Nanoarchaeota archaeon]|nr:2'-5' RNA ligase family protein [Nanoarchaeota archaeon]
MLTYNFSLVFDKDTEEQIREYAIKINPALNTQFDLNAESMPHITIIKFNTTEELNSATIEKIENLCPKELYVTFSGLTLLPSHNAGTWIEISVIKTNNLIKLQKQAELLLPNAQILNKICDGYRPHITLSKTVDVNNLTISNLDSAILRKKNIRVQANLSLAGNHF